ncbi:hypothetical protein ACTG9Q_15270 [Actinokineospora sp. 24-640]
MRAALLTEWTGPLAHALVGELVRAGAIPVVLAGDVAAARAALPPGVVVEEGLGRPNELRLLMSHVDVVIDNRVLPAGGARQAALNWVFCAGTRGVVTAAFDARVRGLVSVRPLGALDGPQAAAHRYACEVLATGALFGVPVASLEVPPLFGPEASASTDLNVLIARLAQGRLAAPPHGTTNLLFAQDAARAVLDLAGDDITGTRVLTGLRHPRALIAELVTAGLGRPTRLVGRLNRLSCLLAGSGRDRSPGTGELSRLVLSQDVAITAAHFRGAVSLR